MSNGLYVSVSSSKSVFREHVESACLLLISLTEMKAFILSLAGWWTSSARITSMTGTGPWMALRSNPTWQIAAAAAGTECGSSGEMVVLSQEESSDPSRSIR